MHLNNISEVEKKDKNKMILLISYDLIGHERPSSYVNVEKAIKIHAGSGGYVKPLYSQFFVDTKESIGYWNKVIREATDSDDCWLITEVAGQAGKYSKKAVDWMKENFKA